MKLKIFISTLTIFMLAGFMCFNQADAQMGRGRCSSGLASGAGPGLGGNCFAGIALTPEQKSRINAIRTQFYKDTVDLRADIYKKKLEMRSLMLEQKTDSDKALKHQEKMFDLKKKLARMKLQARIDVKNSLTPEQIAQLPPGCNFGIGKMGSGTRGSGCGGGCGPQAGCSMRTW